MSFQSAQKIVHEAIARTERNLNLSFSDLTNDDIANLIPDIIQLTNLKSLDLSGNYLTELPPEIGNLTSLSDAKWIAPLVSWFAPYIDMLLVWLMLAIAFCQLWATIGLFWLRHALLGIPEGNREQQLTEDNNSSQAYAFTQWGWMGLRVFIYLFSLAVVAYALPLGRSYLEGLWGRFF